MSLTIPTAPSEAVTALAAALPKLAASPAVSAASPLTAAAVGRFTATGVAVSLPLFVLGLSDVHDGTMAARQVGWRHLLPTGDPVGPVMADTAIRDFNQHIYSGVTESPFARDLENRLTSIPADTTVAAGHYDAAVLEVPAMYVMAIWLRDTSQHDDVVVPVAPSPPSLIAGHHYSTSQFLDALRASANGTGS
jgi:hypothetical protein